MFEQMKNVTRRLLFLTLTLGCVSISGTLWAAPGEDPTPDAPTPAVDPRSEELPPFDLPPTVEGPTCAVPAADKAADSCNCTNNRRWTGTACEAGCSAPHEELDTSASPAVACRCETGYTKNRRDVCLPSTTEGYTWNTSPSILRTSQMRGSTGSTSQCGTDFEICLGVAEKVGSEVLRQVKCFIPRNQLTCPEAPDHETCFFLDANDADIETEITQKRLQVRDQAEVIPPYAGRDVSCAAAEGAKAPACDSGDSSLTDYTTGCLCEGFNFPDAATTCVDTVSECRRRQGVARTSERRGACQRVGTAATPTTANVNRCREYCLPSRGPRTDATYCSPAIVAKLGTGTGAGAGTPPPASCGANATLATGSSSTCRCDYYFLRTYNVTGPAKNCPSSASPTPAFILWCSNEGGTYVNPNCNGVDN